MISQYIKPVLAFSLIFIGCINPFLTEFYDIEKYEKVEGSLKDWKEDGLMAWFYENGHKMRVATIKNGKYNGKIYHWHKNGQKKLEGYYKNQETDIEKYGMTGATGLWTYWYENGNKERKGNFKDGKMDGIWSYWYENGQKDGEGTYKDGRKDGKWTYWYRNGQKALGFIYKDGLLISSKCWDEEGNEKDCN